MKNTQFTSYHMPVMNNLQKECHQTSSPSFLTITLPETLGDEVADVALGRQIIDAWRMNGIVRLRMTPKQIQVFHRAKKICKQFFSQPTADKAKCVDQRTYSGYTGSGEEITNNIEDLPEIFTVMKDIASDDERVGLRWPCHGPCPWPNDEFKTLVDSLMKSLGESGQALMHLIALGLGMQAPEELTEITEDGWHYMRILRYPQGEGKGVENKLRRGIGQLRPPKSHPLVRHSNMLISGQKGPHTDYGLIALTAEDSNGGLWVSPPGQSDIPQDTLHDLCRDNESNGPWVYAPPVEDCLTVFPGDMMSYLTSGYIPATLHKVTLSNAERYSFAYFHEPSFDKSEYS
jgi:isopenicillin N synthase-like dioxygenase